MHFRTKHISSKRFNVTIPNNARSLVFRSLLLTSLDVMDSLLPILKSIFSFWFLFRTIFIFIFIFFLPRHKNMWEMGKK